MDLKLIENIIAIEEEQSISKAADRLFMTQSALNQQLLKLEKDLGIKLFERKWHQMIPTYAGKIYLEAAHKMVHLKVDTYKKIYDISDEVRGEISITFTPEKGSFLFSRIYPYFNKIYPDVTFKIKQAHVLKMEQMLLQQEVNLALVTYTEYSRNSAIHYEDMCEESLVLALPESHPLAHLAGNDSHIHLPPIDLTLLKDETFSLPTDDTLSRKMINHAFKQAGFVPNILFEMPSTITLHNLVKQQVCPTFFPQSYVNENDPIVYFSLEPNLTWKPSIAYLKDTYLSKIEKHFIDLYRQYTQCSQL